MALYLYQLANPAFTIGWSVIPAEITTGTDLVGTHYIGDKVMQHSITHVEGPTPIYLTLLSSMFMHGSWMHLGGNMLYLWIFADNIEATTGNFNFLVFYLLGGLVASMAHILLSPGSTIPTVGASGAISAIMGAYIVCFPKSRIKMIFLILFKKY